MSWLVCGGLLIAYIFTNDVPLLIASGLFAIAGSIETVAVQLRRFKSRDE